MAGPVTAVTTGYAHAFTFTGRATRSEFWWFVLFQGVASWLVLGGLLIINAPLALIPTVQTLALALPLSACLTRRVRDAGRHPLWALPAVLGIVAAPTFNVMTVGVVDELLVTDEAALDDADPTLLLAFYLGYGLMGFAALPAVIFCFFASRPPPPVAKTSAE